MSRVRFLGTGSADGWPSPFCACASCTAERAAGRVRGQTSVLLGEDLLLDCGPETPRAAERLGVALTGLRHVLLTHAHPDHFSPGFLLYRSWSDDRPLDVVGPAAVVEQARMWVAPDSPVRFRAVSAGEVLALGDYTVRVLAARHGEPGSSVLYDVAADAWRMLYATDTGPLPDETVTAAAGAAYDLVVLEETFGDRLDHGTDHLDLGTFPEQLRRLREVGGLTEHTEVVAVHLAHHNPPTPELDRRLAAWGARTVPDGAVLPTRQELPAEPRRPVTSSRPPAGGSDGSAPSGREVVTGRRTLVIGGARSGKSREAERLLAAEADVTYVATSYPGTDDPEWVERVRHHREHRPAHWTTLETIDLIGVLEEPGGPVLVDCLTLWLTRVLDAYDAWDDEVWSAVGEKAVCAEIDALVHAWRATRRRVVAVTNEVGQGVVPDTASGRRFRDLMGRLNVRLAAQTEDVRWCVAGRVVPL